MKQYPPAALSFNWHASRLCRWGLTALAGAWLSACVTTEVQRPAARHIPSYASAAQHPLITTSYQAAARLTHGLDYALQEQAPLLVATVVNVDDLQRSSTLGRALSEMYASALTQQGFNVKELKLRGNLYVKEGAGELMLSREVRDIASQHSAGLVLVGTYSQATHYTYVSLKMVRTADGRIMHSYDYALPNDRDIQRLLMPTPLPNGQ